MKFKLIPSGEFMMGGDEPAETAAEYFTRLGPKYYKPDDFKDEYPQHPVRITKPFYLGKYEVTVAQFRRFVVESGYRTGAEKDGRGGYGYTASKTVGQKPEYSWSNPGFEQGDEHPVTNLGYSDAVEFCEWLSRKEGKTYRLPTEAEWEYACRAGTTTRYYSGNGAEGLVLVGNVCDATAKARITDVRDWSITANDGYAFTAPVGRFRPNAFGLYDMHGNVWELCSGRAGRRYPAVSVDDPKGTHFGAYRVLRGGSCGGSVMCCRSAFRGMWSHDFRKPWVGFRIARGVGSLESELSTTAAKPGTDLLVKPAAPSESVAPGKQPQEIPPREPVADPFAAPGTKPAVEDPFAAPAAKPDEDSVAVPAPKSTPSLSPTPEQALMLTPIQKNVDYDRPGAEERALCKISARRTDGHVGWFVEDPKGMMLRRFTDTNGDNRVDQWSYYKDGAEVYRDIDSDFNGKADQYRWFNIAGSRWGLDKDEDGVIDTWKVISAREVAAEAVAALASRDADRFTPLILRPEELTSLGLGEAQGNQLAGKIAKLPSEFTKAADHSKGISGKTRYVEFSVTWPGTVPAGSEGSTRDLLVYEDAMAVVETEGNRGRVRLGTLVCVGDAWRMADVPRLVVEGRTDSPLSGFFIHHGRRAPSSETSPEMRKLYGDLDQLDKSVGGATSPEARVTFCARRADLLQKIVDQAHTSEEREMWTRRLADWVSDSFQSGNCPDAFDRLQRLLKKLQEAGGQRETTAYVRFRQILVENAQKLQTPGADVPKVQADWLKALEAYVKEYPKAVDASEAMLQLAMNSEFSGGEKLAKKWYARIVTDFPQSPAAWKAAGAQTRLESVGRVISFEGKTTTGETVNLSRLRGNTVLIYYWATWCEPCKAELPTLKTLVSKYGKSGFRVIGVSLDHRRDDLTSYLAEYSLPWLQVWEEGSFDGRPANEFGIVTVPTAILVDSSGKVVSRNIRVAGLETELKQVKWNKSP